MSRPSVFLQYHSEDRAPRTVEALSEHGRISRAFIHLCLALGCPTVDQQQLSLAMLLDWLCGSYPAVRAAAGMPALSGIDDLPEHTVAKLQMGNAMITLLEYAESRSIDPLSRRHLKLMLSFVERSLDC